MLTRGENLMYSFDAGNGTCKGVSSAGAEMIQFEPVIAPLTERRGLKAADEQPTYSLRVGEYAALCRGDTSVLATHFPDLPLRAGSQPVTPRPVYSAVAVTISHAPRSEAEALAGALAGSGLASLDF